MIRVLLGPPGAGKGTQASRLAAEQGWLHLATGDLLRAHLAARTELGLQVEAVMRAGQLVSDETVIDMVAGRLAEPDAAGGVLFDGFPRTVRQAEALDRLAETLGEAAPLAVALAVPRATILARLTGRRTCQAAGHVYHVALKPPAVAEVCDLDGSPLVQRDDDLPETVERRLDVYERETRPVLDYYASAGRLTTVDGEGSPEVVLERLRGALGHPAFGR